MKTTTIDSFFKRKTTKISEKDSHEHAPKLRRLEIEDDFDIDKLERDLDFSTHHETRRRASHQQNRVTVEHYYRVDIFYTVIDSQLQELNNRFNDDSVELIILSSALDPKELRTTLRVDDICKLVEKFYPLDFDEDERTSIPKFLNYVDGGREQENQTCFRCYTSQDAIITILNSSPNRFKAHLQTQSAGASISKKLSDMIKPRPCFLRVKQIHRANHTLCIFHPVICPFSPRFLHLVDCRKKVQNSQKQLTKSSRNFGRNDFRRSKRNNNRRPKWNHSHRKIINHLLCEGPLMATHFDNMNQNAQFRDRANGVSVCGKGIISKAPNKAGRKPLGEISNSNTLKLPQNYVSQKQQNPVDFTCFGDEKGVPKSTLPLNRKKSLSRPVKNATPGARKPLGDISNSRKPALPQIPKKTKVKDANVLELGDTGIGDKGFLHNHAECVKNQRKAVDLDFWKQLVSVKTRLGIHHTLSNHQPKRTWISTKKYLSCCMKNALLRAVKLRC
ncbi:hypothetical protein QQ045_011986 [Rhodiola kirilowii]